MTNFTMYFTDKYFHIDNKSISNIYLLKN